MRLIIPNPRPVQLKVLAWEYDVDHVFSVVGAGPYWQEEKTVLIRGEETEFVSWTSKKYEITMVQYDDSVSVNSGSIDPDDVELDMLGFFATIRLIPSIMVERNAQTRIRHFNYSLGGFLEDTTHPLSMQSVQAHRRAMRIISQEING